MRRKHAFLLLLPFLLLLTGATYGMIRTLPLAELVSRSDYIVIGEVRRIEVDTAQSLKRAGTRYLRNEVAVVECLKGDWPADRPMFFRTIGSDHWIEDNVEFPPPGTGVLIFVMRGESGGLGLVNGIQGLWPLRDGKPLRMGTRYSVEEIRGIIRKQAGAREESGSRAAGFVVRGNPPLIE